MKHLLTCLVLALITLAPASLHAQSPITIEVPVDLQNLHPDVGGARVQCYVAIDMPPRGQEVAASGVPADGLKFGYAEARVGRDGNLRTTIRVPMVVGDNDQMWLHQAREYRCRLGLVAAGETYWELQEGESGGPASARSGSLVAYVEGALPNR